MKYSAYDLAKIYIEKNYSYIDNVEKNCILNEIMEVLDNGVTSNQIYNKIYSFNKINKEHYKMFTSIEPISSCRNLLKQNCFYYHNELRVVPNAPTKCIDYNSDDVFLEDSNDSNEYFLEMRASYTIDDLYNYCLSKDRLREVCSDKDKFIGGINYILKKTSIEPILFMIDVTNSIYIDKEKDMKNIFEILDYKKIAYENYTRRKTEAHNKACIDNCEIGNTKIKVKKRTLFL